MISPAATTNPSEVGRLQAGWHNIRHTAQWDDPSETTHLLSSHTMVIGNTELVVVANYGRRADDFFVASEAKSGVGVPVPPRRLFGLGISEVMR